MLDLHSAWRIIHDNATVACQNQTPFFSARNKVEYTIYKVLPNQIIVRTKNENKGFGPQALKNQLELLVANGGVLHYRKFFQNVAKGTSVVFLHPELAWTDNGQNVRVEKQINLK